MKMVPKQSDRLECYAIIEDALIKHGLRFEQEKSTDDGILNADDVVVYHVFDSNGFLKARVMPTSLDASSDTVERLARNIQEYVSAHSQYAVSVYHFVLCGTGWSDSQILKIKQRVSQPATKSILVEVYTIETLTQNGISLDYHVE
jgi:hypothetical protein